MELLAPLDSLMAALFNALVYSPISCNGMPWLNISYLWNSWKVTEKRRSWTAMLANWAWWAAKCGANLIESSLRNAAKRKRHVSTTWKAVERYIETWPDTRVACAASISTDASRLELQQKKLTICEFDLCLRFVSTPRSTTSYRALKRKLRSCNFKYNFVLTPTWQIRSEKL